MLHVTNWPVESAKAAVVIVHGLAEHSGRYDYVAKALNKAGYTAYGPDLRGHGKSPGFPGQVGGEAEPLIIELAEVISGVEADKVFVLAHSGGTLLTLPAFTKLEVGTVAGLVLSGTATMLAPAALASLAGGEGIPPELISRSTDIVNAYKDDPLVFADSVPMELMGIAMQVTQMALQAVPLINVPVLLVHGGEDQICDKMGSQQVHTELVVTDKTLKIYDGLYHEVLNEPERDVVIKDIVDWLDAH